MEKELVKKGLKQQYVEPPRLERKAHSRLFQYHSLEAWIIKTWKSKEVSSPCCVSFTCVQCAQVYMANSVQRFKQAMCLQRNAVVH